MDRGASSRPSVSVGLAAVDLIGRIFGRGNRRRSKYNSGQLGSLEGYSRLQNTNCLASPRCVEKLESLSDNVDEEEEVTVLLQQRPRSSFSSDDEFSKRWTSADHSCYRRRKGFSCMRLRIVNMARMVAMMRKVRLAYRRMMNAAAASKTILSLADVYNDISDLIPTPCGPFCNKSFNEGLWCQRRGCISFVLRSLVKLLHSQLSEGVHISDFQRTSLSGREQIWRIGDRTRSTTKTITRVAPIANPVLPYDPLDAYIKKSENGTATSRSSRVEVSAKGKWQEQRDSSLSEERVRCQ